MTWPQRALHGSECMPRVWPNPGAHSGRSDASVGTAQAHVEFWGGSHVHEVRADPFLLPMLIVLALVAGWPLARTILFGFTDANLSYLSRTKFIGIDNYLAIYDGEWSGIIADPWWWRAVGNTMVFTVVSVALETIFGFAVALVLNAEFPGRSIVRAVVLIPWAIPTIVSAKMWAWMLHDQFGIVNDML
eukprot:gene27405-30285_t